MSSEIVQKITDFCSSTDLITAMGLINAGQTGGRPPALRIAYKNKVYVLPIWAQWSQTWNYYNSLGLINGKEITLDGKKYIARAMSCINSNGNNDDTEVFQFINKHRLEILKLKDPPYILDYEILSKDTVDSDTAYAYKITRDGVFSRTTRGMTTSLSSLHFAVILESLEGFISVPTTSLGEVYSQASFNYKRYITSDMKIQYIIDGNSKEILSNLTGNDGIFTIKQEWLDSLKYGTHTFTIRVLSSGYDKIQDCTMEFIKARRETQPLTGLNLIEMQNYVNEMNSDLEYQLTLFRDFYKKNNTSIDNTKGLKYLVKSLDIVFFNKRKFATGRVVSSTDSTAFTFALGGTTSIKYMDIVSLTFKPSYLIASYKTSDGSKQFVTILNSLNNQIDAPSVQMLSCTSSTNGEHTYNIKADSYVYHSNGIIRLPAWSTNCNYEWIAFE